MSGRLGTNHSKECRDRIVEAMMNDPIDRHVAESYKKRANRPQEQHDQAEPGPGMASQIINQYRSRTRSDRLLTEKENGLERAMCRVTTNKMDIAEIYSPERTTKVARQMGLRAGWALDLTTADEHGSSLEFDKLEMRNKAVRMLLRDKPTLVIGSPMCTDFSA